MFRSVVVPLDGSTFGERALPMAVVIAEKCEAALHLVHVHTVSGPDTYLDALTPYAFQNVADSTVQHDEEVKREEVAYLETVANRARIRVPVTTSELRLGTGIEREVEAAVLGWNADLVVMATHARDGFSGFRHGSIGEAVVRRLGIPTILMPAAAAEVSVRYPRTPRRILVTLDGSRLAETVLAPATDLARSVGADLTLLAVQEIRDELPTYLARIGDALSLVGLSVATHVIESVNPDQAIVDYLRDNSFDLIAMATHGRTGLPKLLFGSVAARVLHTSHKPVLLLRPHFVEQLEESWFGGEVAQIGW